MTLSGEHLLYNLSRENKTLKGMDTQGMFQMLSIAIIKPFIVISNIMSLKG